MQLVSYCLLTKVQQKVKEKNDNEREKERNNKEADKLYSEVVTERHVMLPVDPYLEPEGI